MSYQVENRFVKNDKYFWVVIFLLVSIVYLASINRPLRDAESKYAEIPREMIVTGDWVTPRLDFARYFTKPPLTFWVTAVAYKIFGVHPWVARLTNIMWAFLAAYLLGILASRMYGAGTGRIAAVMFILTAEVFTYCLDAGIEFGLISCIIASLTAFWIYVNDGRKLYLRLFYLGLGLSFLAKGILGFALPATIAGLYLICSGRLREVWKFLDVPGLVILGLGVLPWTIAMSMRHPDFLKCFVINEHFGAFLGKRDSNDALFPTGLFLALSAGEFFPWILYLPIIIRGTILALKEGGEEKEKVLFLGAWLFVPLMVFSLSKSKVDFYGMHFYPPLLILLAMQLRRTLMEKQMTSHRLWSYPWLLVPVLAIVSLVFLKSQESSQLVEGLGIPSIGVAYEFLITAAVLGFLIFFCWTRKKTRHAFAVIAIFMIFFFYFTEKMFVAAYPDDSMKFAADKYNQVAKEGDILFSDELPEFAHIAILPYYTGKRAYLLRDQKNSKLYFLLKDRMELCFNEDQFKQNVIEQGKIYLVGKTKKTIRRLDKLGLGYRILARSDGKALFVVMAHLKD
ncbi:MAG: hypothetical protein DRG59_04170 [Deltaproteobacteria bacterium]|nr:MAG: hypothetical protein DRG59_04170 [Deltaproteobacteria bacterium]